MATILRSYDWAFVSRNNKKARSRSYPWDDWFDGRIWQLEPKIDFDGPATSLERVIRTTANRRGIKVRIRIDSGNIIVQRHEENKPSRIITKSPSLRSIKARLSPAETAAAAAEKEAAKTAAPASPTKRVAKKVAKPSTNGSQAPERTLSPPIETPRRRKLVKAS
jgi:hypothetical protein